MVIECVPACVREIANNSKDLCSKNFTYSHFIGLMCAIFFNLNSYSSAVRALIFVQSVSSLGRGAIQIPFDKLLKRNRDRVSELLKNTPFPERRFVLIIDDTLVRKFGATPDNCYWFDHCIGACVKGRNYLVLIVSDTFTGQCFPIDAVLLKGKKHSEYKARTQILMERLLLLKESGLGQIPVCADSWFADATFFEWLNDNNFVFEIEIKSNRKITYFNKKSAVMVGEKQKIVYPSISDVACGLKRNTAFSGGAPKQVSGGVVRLLGSKLRLKFAAVWNSDDTQKDRPFAIYVTNKTEFCTTKIWALSRYRWAIECHFRKSKQDFAFDAFPTKSSKTAFNLIVLGMFLMCSLELSRHDPGAKPLCKGDIRTKYLPLSTWVKKEREKSEETTLRRVMASKSSREKIDLHLSGKKNPKFSCMKPRDKTKIKEVHIKYEEVSLCAA